MSKRPGTVNESGGSKSSGQGNRDNRGTFREIETDWETKENLSDPMIQLGTTQVKDSETSVNDTSDIICAGRYSGEDDTNEVGAEPEENKAPDGGWGWMVVAGCLLMRIVIGGILRSHGLFYIKFLEMFKGSATATAIVTSVEEFTRLTVGPFVSILCSKFSSRGLSSFGAGALVLGLLMTIFAPSLEFLYFSFGAICGLGRAFSLTPSPILLGYYFDKRRSLALGLASAGFSIGGFAITPLVEILFQNYGYQGTFLLLSGFATHIFVSAALFRPIELHRKLTAKKGKTELYKHDKLGLSGRRVEHLESVEALHTPTISDGTVSRYAKDRHHSEILGLNTDTTHDISVNKVATDQRKALLNDPNAECQTTENKGQMDEGHIVSNDNSKMDINSTNDSRKKKKWISLSILKDVRFLCYLVAMFCFTLPASELFLPALAKSKGLTDLQAATLVSVDGGFDTVFRVVAGFVLDFKIFRDHRILIYNGMTFIQGILICIFPSLSSFTAFITLCTIDGAVAGFKQAQNLVVMMDMLGIDNFANTWAVTMVIQGIAVVIGPTISGQLKDHFGTYDGAFYFGASAIITGALVMAIGNLRKVWMDRQKENVGSQLNLNYLL